MIHARLCANIDWLFMFCYLCLGEKSVIKSSGYRKTICSSREPFTWSSKYYKVEIELKGWYQPSKPKRGFALGYLTYRDGKITFSESVLIFHELFGENSCCRKFTLTKIFLSKNKELVCVSSCDIITLSLLTYLLY